MLKESQVKQLYEDRTNIYNFVQNIWWFLLYNRRK